MVVQHFIDIFITKIVNKYIPATTELILSLINEWSTGNDAGFDVIYDVNKPNDVRCSL